MDYGPGVDHLPKVCKDLGLTPGSEAKTNYQHHYYLPLVWFGWMARSSFIGIAVIKYPDKKQLRDERVLFNIHFQVIGQHGWEIKSRTSER